MPHYLDDAQRDYVGHLQRTFTGRSEWPTWLLLAVVYAAWLVLLPLSRVIGVWPTTALLIPLLVLWLSLQHELLHGHPTRLAWLNKLLGYAPFALWYPYTLYRDSHLRHHHDEDLTLPGLDPESRYLSDHHWQRSGRLHKALLWLGKTVTGRLLIGAPLGLIGLAREQLVRLARGDRQAWAMWLTHGLCCGLLLTMIARFSALSVLHYVFLVSVPAVGLAMLRSFYEHRPSPLVQQRTVINEAGPVWSLLFLNNNLHLVHHDIPGLAWYFIPRIYRRHRQQWLMRSGHFLVQGYAQLARRHGLAPIDSPRHPFA